MVATSLSSFSAAKCSNPPFPFCFKGRARKLTAGECVVMLGWQVLQDVVSYFWPLLQQSGSGFRAEVDSSLSSSDLCPEFHKTSTCVCVCVCVCGCVCV